MWRAVIGTAPEQLAHEGSWRCARSCISCGGGGGGRGAGRGAGRDIKRRVWQEDCPFECRSMRMLFSFFPSALVRFRTTSANGQKKTNSYPRSDLFPLSWRRLPMYVQSLPCVFLSFGLCFWRFCRIWRQILSAHHILFHHRSLDPFFFQHPHSQHHHHYQQYRAIIYQQPGQQQPG